MRPKGMRYVLVLLALIVAANSAVAGDIRKGAVMQVKPDTIYFEQAADLTQWQTLKKAGDAAALTAFETEKLGSRDAWQLSYPHQVKILGYEPKSNQANVQIETTGRFEGLSYMIDAGALTK